MEPKPLMPKKLLARHSNLHKGLRGEALRSKRVNGVFFSTLFSKCCMKMLSIIRVIGAASDVYSKNSFRTVKYRNLGKPRYWSSPALMMQSKKHRTPVTLELLEDAAWSKGSKYARLNTRNNASMSSGLDTPLQILDAQTLIKQQNYIPSTPGSSLDLEWEHEGMPLPMVGDEKGDNTDGSITQTSNNNSQPSSLTASPWSRVSTPNSLEWDPVEADVVCVDVETEQLLTEIERLTDRVLKETGEWTGNS